MMARPELDECTRRKLAVQADCDPRTISKVYRGGHVRGLAGHRARAVLVAAGLLPQPGTRAGSTEGLLQQSATEQATT